MSLDTTVRLYVGNAQTAFGIYSQLVLWYFLRQFPPSGVSNEGTAGHTAIAMALIRVVGLWRCCAPGNCRPLRESDTPRRRIGAYPQIAPTLPISPVVSPNLKVLFVGTSNDLKKQRSTGSSRYGRCLRCLRVNHVTWPGSTPSTSFLSSVTSPHFDSLFTSCDTH